MKVWETARKEGEVSGAGKFKPSMPIRMEEEPFAPGVGSALRWRARLVKEENERKEDIKKAGKLSEPSAIRWKEKLEAEERVENDKKVKEEQERQEALNRWDEAKVRSEDTFREWKIDEQLKEQKVWDDKKHEEKIIRERTEAGWPASEEVPNVKDIVEPVKGKDELESTMLEFESNMTALLQKLSGMTSLAIEPNFGESLTGSPKPLSMAGFSGRASVETINDQRTLNMNVTSAYDVADLSRYIGNEFANSIIG